MTPSTVPLGAGTPHPLDLDAARQLDDNKLQRLDLVRERAQKWIAGTTALSGALGGVLVVKGRDNVAQMPTAWRAVTAATLAGALALLLAGTFLANRAAYGRPGSLDELSPIPLGGLHSRLIEARGTAADKALDDVAAAVKTVAAALALVAFSVGITWFAPSRSATPNKTVCLYYEGRLVAELATESAALKRAAVGATVGPCATTTSTPK